MEVFDSIYTKDMALVRAQLKREQKQHGNQTRIEKSVSGLNRKWKRLKRCKNSLLTMVKNEDQGL